MPQSITINAAVSTADRLEDIASGVHVEISGYQKENGTTRHHVYLQVYESEAAKDAGKSTIAPTNFEVHTQFDIPQSEITSASGDVVAVYYDKVKAWLASKLETPSSNIVINS